MNNNGPPALCPSAETGGMNVNMEPIAIAAPLSGVDRTTAMACAGTVGFSEVADIEEYNSARPERDERCATLRFLVSQNEEHVRLELNMDGSTVDLGERAHHQTLLLLARERRRDERQSVNSSEAGWRDVVLLGSMLGIDTQHINTHLFRALRQLSPALRQLAIELSLIERRRGQVRFGDAAFEVVDWRGLAPVRA